MTRSVSLRTILLDLLLGATFLVSVWMMGDHVAPTLPHVYLTGALMGLSWGLFLARVAGRAR